MKEIGKVAMQAEKEFLDSSDLDEATYANSIDELRFERLNWYVSSGVDPEDARVLVEQEERNFVVTALQQDKNPAAEIMRLHAAVKPRPIPGREVVEEGPKAPKPVAASIAASKQGVSEAGLQSVPDRGAVSGTITAEQFAELDEQDPLFHKIASNPALFERLNVYGEVNI